MIHNIFQHLKKESKFENEPAKKLILLRWLYILLAGYYLIFFITGCFWTSYDILWVSLLMFGLDIFAFLATYRYRTVTNLYLFVTFQLLWLILIVLLYGWNCGFQLMMFSQMVLVYFFFYDRLREKIMFTICLFCLRYALFLHWQFEGPVVTLPSSLETLMQVINSWRMFVELGIICGIFSSNVESTEKKLVLYNQILKKQASTDPLTGLWNRRTMLQLMEEMIQAKDAQSFSIAIADIDHFKQINDTRGHNCGDAVLVKLSELFRSKVETNGYVCRWGGEEFLFLFPDMNGDQAYHAIVDLKNAISMMQIAWGNEEVSVTLTYGIEEYDFESNLDELVSKVDQKLYIGKESGRNRIIY